MRINVLNYLNLKISFELSDEILKQPVNIHCGVTAVRMPVLVTSD